MSLIKLQVTEFTGPEMEFCKEQVGKTGEAAPKCFLLVMWVIRSKTKITQVN